MATSRTPHPQYSAAFAAAVTATAATYGIARAEARQSGRSLWVVYDSPLGGCTHTEACSRRREAELRFEKAIQADLLYTF